MTVLCINENSVGRRHGKAVMFVEGPLEQTAPVDELIDVIELEDSEEDGPAVKKRKQ